MDDLKKELAKRLSSANVLLEADLDLSGVGEMDVDLLASRLIGMKEGSAGLKIITSTDVSSAIEDIGSENASKAPKPIEVLRTSDFKPMANEVEADYKIENNGDERIGGSVDDFVSYFRNRLQRIKEMIGMHRNYILTPTLETLKNYAEGREVVVAGIVTNRALTKNGNMMALIEDETGEAKVIFMNAQNQEGKRLFEDSAKVVNDEVIAVRGKVSGPFIMAKELIWPGVPIKERKHIDDDIAIAFISDTHVGSKLFMEKNFSKMIEWLNGNVDSKSRALAGKIKYIIVAGDVADGIGVYPGQENDLAVLDVYKQYKMFSTFLESIPEYIHVFVLPGNHDAVQRAEPQPELSYEVLGTKQSNIHLIQNPSYVTTHGISTLAYHGTSLDSMISSIPNMSYSRPEEVMIEVLKRRHLSPIYGGNVVVPTHSDGLVIENVPDILNMGHIHKPGISEYHGVQVVNSGTWVGRTDYQIKRGLFPVPCVFPVFEAKSYSFTTIDFRDVV